MSTSEGTTTNGVGELRLADLELALNRIPSVTAARVVTGAGGRIAEVHVLATDQRSPKQVVRDVQSVALTSFGIEVDYRTISVVQLEGAEQHAGAVSVGTSDPGAVLRPALLKVNSEVAGHAIEVGVEVRTGDRTVTGSARGPASSGAQLVCRAVIDSVSALLGDAVVDVDIARYVDAGQSELAVCVVRTATAGGDIAVSGSALVRRDANDAMARATLAALNRLISRSSHDGNSAQTEGPQDPPSA